jgi:hypothetical protein
MRIEILIPILKELKGNDKELYKLRKFVQTCKVFKGNRREIYKLIARYKNKRGDK